MPLQKTQSQLPLKPIPLSSNPTVQVLSQVLPAVPLLITESSLLVMELMHQEINIGFLRILGVLAGERKVSSELLNHPQLVQVFAVSKKNHHTQPSDHLNFNLPYDLIYALKLLS
jgi:hypothetical protein